ncbi:MAG: HNH endonuclease signature motif containing protein [Syntrophobacteraceae bacterium]
MSDTVSESLRRLVSTRAERLCEYCLIHEDDTFFGCQVDHIISLKHGGTTHEGNLAYACVFCNPHKRADIGSVLADTGEFIRFYNPRQDKWSGHFRLEGPLIKPIADIFLPETLLQRANA